MTKPIPATYIQDESAALPVSGIAMFSGMGRYAFVLSGAEVPHGALARRNGTAPPGFAGKAHLPLAPLQFRPGQASHWTWAWLVTVPAKGCDNSKQALLRASKGSGAVQATTAWEAYPYAQLRFGMLATGRH